MKISFTKRQVLWALGAWALAASAGAKPGFPVLGYFPTWGGVAASAIPYNSLTHVMVAFALPNTNGTLSFSGGYPTANLVTTAHSNSTKVILSVGGASIPNSTWDSATTGGNMAVLVNAIVAEVDARGYDGVDIDWEFPGATETAQFTSLMQQVYAAMQARTAYDGSKKETSFFISPGYYICGMDWNNLGQYCDFAVLPGYDICSGPSPYFEGPIDIAQTFFDCRGISVGLDVKGNADKLTGGGAQQFSFPKDKLLLGLPFYTCGAGATLESITNGGTKGAFNAQAMETSWTNGAVTQWVTDNDSVCAKMNWAFGYGMSGLAIWEITQAIPAAGTAEVALVWNSLANSGACSGATPTPSPTRSPTRSSTPSPSATRTQTPSHSPSATPTPSVSPSATRSASPSPSATPSASATSSASPTRTASASSTTSPSASPTRTASASPTASPSASPTRTASASPTDSPSASPTRTPTASPTASPSPSVTASFSPSSTASASPTATPSLTQAPAGSTETPTSTASPSFSSSPSATPSYSPSASPMPSATSTATPSGTPTPSPTPSVAAATPTATYSPTFSPTGTATPSPGPAPSATYTPLSTALPSSQDLGGPLKPEDFQAVPNPQSGSALFFQVKLPSGAERLELKLYTKAHTAIQRLALEGPFGPGWSGLSLPLEAPLPGGGYYVLVTARRQAEAASGPIAKLYYLP